MSIEVSKREFCHNVSKYVSLVKNTTDKIIVTNRGKEECVLSAVNSQKEARMEAINKIRNKFKGKLNCNSITETVLPPMDI
ncbi:hypothetical protein IB642_00190 [Allofrancisella guangzhouensis]|uniref:Antitoxin n=2 Tax=Allofrancisella TaxID=1869285 RepID=A0A0A8E464_9GAMM|nr:hypothetical protein [Allofrancisella]AJC48739.1 hypothetical protein SD28_03330 [Allofrancisella guangzhouensis]MBK2027379.1 hypothetical protein [Allofrancisella guangzhouensis]MBK2043436.1 hypothetical protein [Allofrancisella guangzhouensis]MBK2045205.1 hypothetical protein [Allofrancisella guangzhouensis]QIV96471.1 hypothetical protein E4K63_06360 [Allofrancisella inopinata]